MEQDTPTAALNALPQTIPHPVPRALHRDLGRAILFAGREAIADLASRYATPEGPDERALLARAQEPSTIHARASALLRLTYGDHRAESALRAIREGRLAVIGLDNVAMETAINMGRCIDLRRSEERTPEGHYILPAFIDGMDYADSSAEAWVWSIGRVEATGQVLASTGTALYQADGVTCLFLR